MIALILILITAIGFLLGWEINHWVHPNDPSAHSNYGMHPPVRNAWLGGIDAILAVLIFAYYYYTTGVTVGMLAVLLILVIYSIYMMLLPIRGIREVTVNNRNIAVWRWGKKKQEFQFRDIRHVDFGARGFIITLNDNTQKQVMIPGTYTNLSNFAKHLSREKISVNDMLSKSKK